MRRGSRWLATASIAAVALILASTWLLRAKPHTVAPSSGSGVASPDHAQASIGAADLDSHSPEQGREPVQAAARTIPERQNTPGGTREIEKDRGKQIHVFGRVVAAEEQTPLARALVRACAAPSGGSDRRTEELTRTTTDESGSFELEVLDLGGPFLRVEAEGFGVGVLRGLQGHDAPQRPLTVELTRAATLVAMIRDAQGNPVPGVMVRVSTSDGSLPQDQQNWTRTDVPNEQWTGVTLPDGECTLKGLLPGSWISVEISLDGKTLRRENEGLVLEPGQVLRREWIIGGVTLNGIALDQDSLPVTGLEIWLVNWIPGEYFGYDAEGRVAGKAVTDGDGRFHLTDVTPGPWWIGPAPPPPTGASEIAGTSDSVQRIAPKAVSLEVLPSASQDVTLRVYRGLFIRGHVLDPEGHPEAHAFVVATQRTGALEAAQDASGADGTFAVGPLAPGTFSLSASAMNRFANSDTIEVDAGASDLVLRLNEGGGLRGRVVDVRTGRPCAAEVGFIPRSSSTGMFDMDVNGSFDVQGLMPGDYAVVARTEDGRFGILPGLPVVAGEKGKEFVLSVSPGGRVNVRYSGAHSFVTFTIQLEGVQLGWVSSVSVGKLREVLAPAGDFGLECASYPGGRPHVLTVHLDPGEVKEVRLTDHD